MNFIWLLTVITFLSKHTIADYEKTTIEGTWTDMRNYCTLATPTIIFSAEDLTVDFGIDVELYEGEKLWVGYIEDFEIYSFYGCINQHLLQERNALGDAYVLEKNTAVGLCYTVCRNERFFGVKENEENKTTCHCVINSNLPNLNTARNQLNSCNSSDDKGFAYGRRQFLAVYERVGPILGKKLKNMKNWNETQRNCLCNFDPSMLDIQWLPCTGKYHVLCVDLSGTAFFLTASLPWKRAVDFCVEQSSFPLSYQSSNLPNGSTFSYWLANIRSMTIIHGTDQTASNFVRYGYIVRENTKVLLKFEHREENFKGLCFEDTTNLDQNVDYSSEKSSKLLGVYVALPIVIVLGAIVVGKVIVLKRRRRSSPEQVDNTKRNLTYEPDMQPNQNTHRPDSAEVYHEIQDVTESTNEGYDTIPDGYLHKSTQNNNTEVDCFVLEKHDNYYEFAREVTGETEHEYGGQPIKITTAVTDDYDHIGEGNTAQKQSLGDQPYDKISNVVKDKDWDPTYDHSGDHTTYDHTGDNSTFDRIADCTTYDNTGRHTTYDHTGDHTTYDHTGNYGSNEDAVNSAYNDHTEDNADYDHIADHSS